MKTRNPLQQAFTLIEILIAVAIIGIVVSIAIPALHNSRRESREAAAELSAKTLNDAVTRAKIKGDTNSVLDGDDAVAAASYLMSQGYVQHDN